MVRGFGIPSKVIQIIKLLEKIIEIMVILKEV